MSPFEIKDMVELIFKHCNYPPSLLTFLLLNKRWYDICKKLMPEKQKDLIRSHMDVDIGRKTYYNMVEGTNKKHAFFEIKRFDCPVVKGYYHYGKPNGEWTEYSYPDRSITCVKNYNMGKLEGKFKTFKKKNNFLFKSYNLICKEIDYINDRKNGTSYKYYLDTNSFDKYHKKIPQKITKYKDGKKDGYQLIFHKFDSKMWLFISQKQIEYVTDIVLENPKEYCKIVQRLILWNNGKKVVENFYSPNDNGFQSKTIYYKEGKIERMLIYTNNGELKRIIEESIVDDKEEFVKCIKYSPKYHITDSGEHIHHNDEIISQEIFRLRDFKKF